MTAGAPECGLPGGRRGASLSSQRLNLKNKFLSFGLLNFDYALCVRGTFGAEVFHLKPRPQDIIVTKQRYRSFIGTNLDLILRALSQKSLIFCGGATNICLESSVRHAFMLDYYCVVVSDCSPTPWSDEAYKATLANVELAFGEVITLKQALLVWEKKTK